MARRTEEEVPSPAEVKAELERIEDKKTRRYATTLQGALITVGGLERSLFDLHHIVDCWLVEYGPLWEEAGWKVSTKRRDAATTTIYIEEADDV